MTDLGLLIPFFTQIFCQSKVQILAGTDAVLDGCVKTFLKGIGQKLYHFIFLGRRKCVSRWQGRGGIIVKTGFGLYS